jgi:hypothetical protein
MLEGMLVMFVSCEAGCAEQLAKMKHHIGQMGGLSSAES